MPRNSKLGKKPIFRIGKYYSNFFVIYPHKIMIYDGYIEVVKSKSKSILKSEITQYNYLMEEPYYDYKSNNLNEILNLVFKGIANKLENINNAINLKAKGETIAESHEFNFRKEGEIIREYAQDIIDKTMITSGDLIGSIDLSSSISSIIPPRFLCYCCFSYFLEKFKIRYPCGCTYYKEHNNKSMPGWVCRCGANQLRNQY